jgi:hypothetical protein
MHGINTIDAFVINSTFFILSSAIPGDPRKIMLKIRLELEVIAKQVVKLRDASLELNIDL